MSAIQDVRCSGHSLPETWRRLFPKKKPEKIKWIYYHIITVRGICNGICPFLPSEVVALCHPSLSSTSSQFVPSLVVHLPSMSQMVPPDSLHLTVQVPLSHRSAPEPFCHPDLLLLQLLTWLPARGDRLPWSLLFPLDVILYSRSSDFLGCIWTSEIQTWMKYKLSDD